MRYYLFLFFFTASLSARAIQPDTTLMIPMRDGEFLAGDVYLTPNDPQAPTILVMTPYLRVLYYITGLPLNIGHNIANSNYNIVIVDWRCFGGSLQACIAQPDNGEDGYDCVQWIAQQSWSDGQVGMWGPSALGRVQFLTAKENPPALKCIVPLVAGPQTDYQEYYPGGVLRTEYIEQLDVLGFGTSALVMNNFNQVDNFIWQSVANSSNYPDSIPVPTLMIGGWYDHTIDKMLDFFNGIRTQSPANVQNQHRLLMGPWVHGGNGTAQVGTAAQGQLTYSNAADWNDSLALAFYDFHMRGIANGWSSTPFVQYYQMGEDQWQNSPAWPPTGLTNYNLYLHSDTSLHPFAPFPSTGSLSYSCDPLDPSPTIGGPTLRADLDQGPYDQAAQVESRNDILTFTTPPLPQNVVMKGKAQAHLKISSDRVDADFMVRLTDVYPDGRSMLVQTGARRMRSRNGYTAADTALMTPNQVYDCVIDLPASAITFLAGHRIRVDISSSNYPQYNRNANNGGPLYPGTPPSPDSLVNPLIATNTIYTNAANASYVTFPFVSYPMDAICFCEPEPAFLQIVPNPSAQPASLQVWMKQSGILRAEIYDVTGKRVWESASHLNAGMQRVSLPHALAAGVYVVRAQNGVGLGTAKWIKR